MQKMYDYENHLFEEGYHFIGGCDEAGRGPLAGPVFAACVILNPQNPIDGLNDSKQLSEKKRNQLFDEIIHKSLSYGISQVSEQVIDQINIYQASRLAMMNAISLMNVAPDFILTDAMPLPESKVPFLSIIKGDTLSATIAAASILAKVSRDRYMEELSKEYPEYGFAKHKGYPTKAHILAIVTHGILPIHRKTYDPVKSMLKKQIAFDFEKE